VLVAHRADFRRGLAFVLVAHRGSYRRDSDLAVTKIKVAALALEFRFCSAALFVFIVASPVRPWMSSSVNLSADWGRIAQVIVSYRDIEPKPTVFVPVSPIYRHAW
jgi:hypothetical protein